MRTRTLLPVLLALVPTAARAQAPADDPAQVATLQGRYERVERELLRADVSHLSPAQREARRVAIGVLRAYRQRASFGFNRDFPGARVPHFVDGEGQRCAVAELLHATGEDGMVERVVAFDNHAWVVDLEEDALFRGWLEERGLSLAEAARIQGPPIVIVPPPTFEGPIDGVPTSTEPVGRAAPAAAAPSPAAPTSPAPSAGAPSTPSPSLPPGLSPTTDGDGAWWLWWEYNKAEYLQPNRLELWDFPLTGDDLQRSTAAGFEHVRAALQPPLIRALEHRHPVVRAAAAVALGRVGGGDAVPHLTARLTDTSQRVRNQAVLALGASGAPEAQALLLELARGEGPWDVSPDSRALAIVALGLGRRCGFDESLDEEIAALVRERARSDRERIGLAAMMYHTLAPGDVLRPVALGLALDEDEPVAVRCRAAEALRHSPEARALSALQDLAHGSRLDLRRSAAMALGGNPHVLSLPPLLTAYDLEREPLARGFLALSIGRQGGEQARDFLLEEIETGPKTLRPWHALALGLVARRDDDPVARAAVREALAREKNRGNVAAYWLAAGLARDVEATAMLRRALFEASDQRNRMYAASALALIGTDEARAALLERLESERAQLTRVAIAQALGQFGRLEDAPVLLDVLRELREPSLQGLAASAMGFHGSAEGLRRLGDLVGARDTNHVTRAAAIDGVGMLLGRSRALSLSELSRSANFTLFRPWTDELLQVTL